MRTERQSYVVLWLLVERYCNLFESNPNIFKVADNGWSWEADANYLSASSRESDFGNPRKYSSGINLTWLCATLKVFKMLITGFSGGISVIWQRLIWRHWRLDRPWKASSSKEWIGIPMIFISCTTNEVWHTIQIALEIVNAKYYLSWMRVKHSWINCTSFLIANSKHIVALHKFMGMFSLIYGISNSHIKLFSVGHASSSMPQLRWWFCHVNASLVIDMS